MTPLPSVPISTVAAVAWRVSFRPYPSAWASISRSGFAASRRRARTGRRRRRSRRTRRWFRRCRPARHRRSADVLCLERIARKPARDRRCRCGSRSCRRTDRRTVEPKFGEVERALLVEHEGAAAVRAHSHPASRRTRPCLCAARARSCRRCPMPPPTEQQSSPTARSMSPSSAVRCTRPPGAYTMTGIGGVAEVLGVARRARARRRRRR